MKFNKLCISLLLFTILLVGCKKVENYNFIAYKTDVAPSINGIADDTCWQKGEWYSIDQTWLGDSYSTEDFMGHYKLSWSDDALYLLVKITDNILLDQYKDPLNLWWDDDCVEVFIDEDNSGGEHQYNHNAFAYHVALDGNVVDLGPDKKPHLYNDHVISKRVTNGNTSIWEMKIKLFDDTFKDGKTNVSRKLKPEEIIGFALAYCDNDASKQRENFIGNVVVEGEDKNRGWIDAGIFGDLLLKQ